MRKSPAPRSPSFWAIGPITAGGARGASWLAAPETSRSWSRPFVNIEGGEFHPVQHQLCRRTRSPIITPSNLGFPWERGARELGEERKAEEAGQTAHHHQGRRSKFDVTDPDSPSSGTSCHMAVYSRRMRGCANIERARQRTVPPTTHPPLGFWGAWVWWACLTATLREPAVTAMASNSFFVLFLEQAPKAPSDSRHDISAWRSHPAAKSPVLISPEKRLEAGGRPKCNCLVERGGHENAAPAALQVLDCNGAQTGAFQDRHGKPAANINNGNNIREPPAFSADWTGLATSEAGRAS